MGKRARSTLIYLDSQGRRCVNVDGAAALIGISKQAVSVAVKRGRLPAERPNKRMVIIPVAAARAYKPDKGRMKSGRCSWRARSGTDRKQAKTG